MIILQDAAGDFLGSRWPLLLEKLVEAGVFGRTNMTNYEAMCSSQREVDLDISAAEQITISFHPLKLVTAAFANLLSLFELLHCCMMRHVSFSPNISFWSNLAKSAKMNTDIRFFFH